MPSCCTASLDGTDDDDKFTPGLVTRLLRRTTPEVDALGGILGIRAGTLIGAGAAIAPGKLGVAGILTGAGAAIGAGTFGIVGIVTGVGDATGPGMFGVADSWNDAGKTMGLAVKAIIDDAATPMPTNTSATTHPRDAS